MLRNVRQLLIWACRDDEGQDVAEYAIMLAVVLVIVLGKIVYRRSVPRLGHNQAIGAIAHRQCRLIWLILHQGVRYEERGPVVTNQSKKKRTARMIRQLRSLGYRIESPNSQSTQPQAP